VNEQPRRKRSSTTGIALGTVVSASAAPYGYTVSLWSSGALLIHFRGAPNVGEVFLFAAGALAGFALLGMGVRPTLEMSGTIEGSSERVLTGALHWFSVGVAVGAVALVAQIPSWLAWPLGSVTATTLFLLCSSLQLAFVTSRSSRDER
jgi:hypothetical protein